MRRSLLLGFFAFLGVITLSGCGGDDPCPAGTIKVNDSCVPLGKVFLTSSNGTAGFYKYDVATDAWTTVASPPVVTYSQITTDGTLVYLLGSDNTIYSYSPATDTWSTKFACVGCNGGTPIGFFAWTEKGFYYANDGTTTLYHSDFVPNWTSQVLPTAWSCAGNYDAATGNIYARHYGNLGVAIFDTDTNTLAQSWPAATGVGENSRSGTYYGGYFYERAWSGSLQKVNMATGVITDTGVTPAEGHTSTTVSTSTGDIYIGPYSPTGTAFEVFHTANGTLSALAPLPVAVSNHSTIVWVP